MRLSKTTISDCSVVDVSKIHNKAGNITVVENNKNISFEVKRVYYLYDIPGGESRGGHAHYQLEQYIVAASGSFEVVLDDGTTKKKVMLNHPSKALHVVPGMWRELTNFSSGAICLVLASHLFEKEDYIRNYEEFLRLKQ